MNAYYLVFACLLITAAGLGDRFGRRRVLCLGLLIFAMSSAGAALAPGIGWLIAARAVQGGAAAAVLPLTLTVISEAYPPRARGGAIGVWGALLGAGGVLGPLLGGGILELAGWRGIFWVNVPIGLSLAVATRLVVAESRGPRDPLDVRGLVLASTGCLAVAWGLVRSSSRGWGEASVWLPLFIGSLVLVGFVASEQATPFPMMPTSLFALRSFSAANGVSFCIYASLSGGLFLMSQFFQIAQHCSPVVAALRFVPWPLPSLLLAPLVGSLATRVGNRPFLVAGMLLQTIGMVWFGLVVRAWTPYLLLCSPLVLSGIGLAFVFPTVSGEVVCAVPRERMGIAAGVNGSIRELGGVLGVALTATVFAHTGGYATRATFTAGFIHAIWACAMIAGVGVVAALLVAPQRPTAAVLAGEQPEVGRPVATPQN